MSGSVEKFSHVKIFVSINTLLKELFTHFKLRNQKVNQVAFLHKLIYTFSKLSFKITITIKAINMKPVYVILAEDDDDDFFVFSTAIDEVTSNCTVKRVPDGEILMKELKAQCPDILFLNIFMPCKDGRLCIMEIRADRQYDSLPVIMYSSNNFRSEIDFFLKNGATLYIVKPGSFDELKNILKKILSLNLKEFKTPSRHEFVVTPHTELI